MTQKIYKAGEQSKADPFTFVMSTPSRDRYGDIVEQDWKLKDFRRNPVALWMHDNSSPIGTWAKVGVSDGRLQGKLELAKQGTSKLIDFLRSMIEQRALKAVSVGFTPNEFEALDEDKPWDGYRLSGNELLECSLVTVPANPEALSIAKAFGIDERTRAHLFRETAERMDLSAAKQLGVKQPSRDSGKILTLNPTPKQRNRDMSLSDKIEAKRVDLLKSRDTLTAVINREEPEDGDDLQIDELSAQVEAQEQELERFLKAEKALAIKAGEGSSGQSSQQGSKAKRITSSKPRYKGQDAMRTVSCLLKGFTTRESPLSIARETFKDDPEMEILVRAASAPANMTDADWASNLVRDTWGEFLDLVRDVSIYPQVPGERVDFDRYGRIVRPRNDGRGELAGGFVGAGAPIPVKQGTIGSVDLAPKKMAVISAFDKELEMHSMPSIEQTIRNQIVGDTAEVLDTLFLDGLARTAIRPAGLQDTTETGAANIVASGGATPALIDADTKALLSRVYAARVGRAGVWIMNPLTVLGLRTVKDAASGDYVYKAEINGGTFQGYPFLQSSNVTAGIVAFVAEGCMIHGNDYAPVFDVSEQATLVFDDAAPEHIVDAGVATTQPVQSLFQTASIAVRMMTGMDWRISRTGGVQVLTGVAW